MYKRSIKPRLAIGEHAIYERERVPWVRARDNPQVIVSRNSKRMWQIHVRNMRFDSPRLHTNKFSNEMTAIVCVHALLGKGFYRAN